jgi:flagellar hook-associated protein 3 FlgL
MNTTSIGDLSQSYMLRQRNGAIKQDIARLTEELATGRTADMRNVLIGNYAFLADTERKTDVLAGFGVATAEATQFSNAMELALGEFAQQVGSLSSTLISAGISASGINVEELSTQARDTFAGLIGTLNASSAGRQLFSGNATNQQPMADANGILADLTAAISGAATPADMITQATAWFDDPAGFLASAYQGSAEPMGSFALSDRENVTLDVRGNDPELR